MSRSFEEIRDDFMRALQARNWNDIVVHATNLLLIDNKLPWVWANRAMGLHSMGHHLDALINYDKALEIEEMAIAHNNKGTVYFDLEKSDEAYASYTKALEINPEFTQAHMNMGHVHKWLGDGGKAIESYRKSISFDPEYADAQMALAMALLRDGEFEEGWSQFEWRWKTDQMVSRWLKKAQWKGEDLSNKILLIYAEQGLGDILQFARYVRLVQERFPKCKIIVEAKQPVKRLLETMPEIYSVINFGDRMPIVDFVIPMMSLPALFTKTVSDIPVATPEYWINQDDVDTWGIRLQPLFEKCPNSFKIGICWAGMSRTMQPMAMKVDSLRSTTLDTFAALAKIPNIAWVSLQKGPPASQIQKPPAGMTIGDFTEDMYDFYETCAAIKNCDLVISVDTAVVHAAASVGVPTWLLSRWDGCWRWMGDRTDSPWYPTLRQFVQPKPHDWDGMVQEVAKELVKLIKDKNAPELDLTTGQGA